MMVTTTQPENFSGNIGAQHMVLHDEGLLARARMQWQSEDWDSLSNIDSATLHHHPDKAKLALLAAVGHLRSNNLQTSRELVAMAIDWGCSKRLVAQVFVTGVHKTLGKAAIAAGNQHRAVGHFRLAALVSTQMNDGSLKAAASVIPMPMPLSQTAGSFVPASAADLPTPEKPDAGITSFAQNFEDVMLWRALGRVDQGFYIDVGAQSPTVDSVSRAFYEHGWRGIHVEPIPEYAQALRAARPGDDVIEAVLAENSAKRTFFQIPQTGLSTGAKEFADMHKQHGWEVQETLMPATTLADVFEIAGRRTIHWLKVDVEGMEDQVLTGWRHHPARPWVVVIEATEPNSEIPTWHLWETHLFAREYVFVYFDGLNRFYIHEAHSELIPAFKTPPNVFDHFKINN